MENIIGLKEFRADVPGIVSRIAKGQSFVVIKRSKPVFKMVPVDEENSWETVIDFTKIKKGGVHIQDIIAAIAHERTAKSNRKVAKRI